MDKRLAIVGVGLVGTLLGVVVMVGMAPDTGEDDAPAPAVVRAAPAAAQQAPSVAQAPAAGVPDGQVPDEEPAPQGERERMAGMTWERILKGEVDAYQPVEHEVWEPEIKRPQGDVSTMLKASDKPLPADVVGVEIAFDRAKAAIDECLKWEAPRAYAGEKKVVMDVEIVLDGQIGRLGSLTAHGDDDNRYFAFVPCVRKAIEGAVFQPPDKGEPVEVQWPVFR